VEVITTPRISATQRRTAPDEKCVYVLYFKAGIEPEQAARMRELGRVLDLSFVTVADPDEVPDDAPLILYVTTVMDARLKQRVVPEKLQQLTTGRHAASRSALLVLRPGKNAQPFVQMSMSEWLPAKTKFVEVMYPDEGYLIDDVCRGTMTNPEALKILRGLAKEAFPDPEPVFVQAFNSQEGKSFK
jgi:hypothetical protein